MFTVDVNVFVDIILSLRSLICLFALSLNSISMLFCVCVLVSLKLCLKSSFLYLCACIFL